MHNLVREKHVRPLNLANLARRVIQPKTAEQRIFRLGRHAFRRGLANFYSRSFRLMRNIAWNVNDVTHRKAEVAQLVEQPIRNRQVGGSSPPLGSSFLQMR